LRCVSLLSVRLSLFFSCLVDSPPSFRFFKANVSESEDERQAKGYELRSGRRLVRDVRAIVGRSSAFVAGSCGDRRTHALDTNIYIKDLSRSRETRKTTSVSSLSLLGLTTRRRSCFTNVSESDEAQEEGYELKSGENRRRRRGYRDTQRVFFVADFFFFFFFVSASATFC
jgi:hypothetical protein